MSMKPWNSLRRWGGVLGILSTRGGVVACCKPRRQRCPSHAGVRVCHYPLGVPPGRPGRDLTVRVVSELSYGLTLGTSFSRVHKSIFDFGPSKGLKPEPSATWLPFADESIGGPESPLVERSCILAALTTGDGPDRPTSTPVPPVAS